LFLQNLRIFSTFPQALLILLSIYIQKLFIIEIEIVELGGQ